MGAVSRQFPAFYAQPMQMKYGTGMRKQDDIGN